MRPPNRDPPVPPFPSPGFPAIDLDPVLLECVRITTRLGDRGSQESESRTFSRVTPEGGNEDHGSNGE
jgi:hypothetical protein